MKIIDTSQLKFETGTYGNEVLTANEREWIYNGFDTCVTHEVRDKLLSEFDPISRRVYDFARALQGPILEMTLRGLRVNQPRRGMMLSAIMRDINQLQVQLLEIVREGVGYFPVVTKGDVDVWWRSPVKLKNLLHDVMGLKPVRKRNAAGGFAPTVDRDALEKLSLNFIAEPIIRHILILRDLDKKRQFLETGIDPDGYFRFGLNIAGTNTFRLSSSDSDLETGSNSQNVGRSLRSIFCADPGMKLGNLDLEQADSRNLGALCWELFWEEMGDAAGRYLDACESGDLHTYVCRMANPQLPWPVEQSGWRAVADEIAYRDFSHRDMAKRLGHGSNFLGTPPTMSMHTKIPVGQVKDFQSAYFAGFPEIPRYHRYVRQTLAETAQLTNLYGFRRYFFGRVTDEDTVREAVSFNPQSMTANEINIGMLNIFRSGRVQLLAQVHDSILFQYPEEQEDEIIPWALQELRAPLTLRQGREFCVPTEAKVGWNWGEENSDPKKGLLNPDGLIKYKGTDKRRRTEAITHSWKK